MPKKQFRLTIQLDYNVDKESYGTDDTEEQLAMDKENFSDPYTLYELLEYHWEDVKVYLTENVPKK